MHGQNFILDSIAEKTIYLYQTHKEIEQLFNWKLHILWLAFAVLEELQWFVMVLRKKISHYSHTTSNAIDTTTTCLSRSAYWSNNGTDVMGVTHTLLSDFRYAP